MDLAPELRSATHADLEGIRELVIGIAGEYGFAPEPEGADEDLFAGSGDYFAEGAMLRVLTQGGGIVGMVGVLPRADGTAELRKIYLASALRGGGHGRVLLEQAVGFAREQGASRLVLQTSSLLVEAIRMYERAGFERIEGETRSETCDVRMQLAL